MDHEYFVYIVRCADGSLYTGITNDVQRRVSEHNLGKDHSAYTYTRRPVMLVYSSYFQDVHEAISWEKRVKRWSKRKKEALIAGRFNDLSRYAQGKNYSLHKLCVMVRQAHHDTVPEIFSD